MSRPWRCRRGVEAVATPRRQRHGHATGGRSLKMQKNVWPWRCHGIVPPPLLRARAARSAAVVAKGDAPRPEGAPPLIPVPVNHPTREAPPCGGGGRRMRRHCEAGGGGTLDGAVPSSARRRGPTHAPSSLRRRGAKGGEG
jgi:hypothetical protein